MAKAAAAKGGRKKPAAKKKASPIRGVVKKVPVKRKPKVRPGWSEDEETRSKGRKKASAQRKKAVARANQTRKELGPIGARLPNRLLGV